MKKQTNIQLKVKSKIQSNITESITGTHETSIQLKPGTTKSNMILVQNIGKDPPGRCRSPEEACRLDPEKRPVSIKSNKTLFNIDFQIFKQMTLNPIPVFPGFLPPPDQPARHCQTQAADRSPSPRSERGRSR